MRFKSEDDPRKHCIPYVGRDADYQNTAAVRLAEAGRMPGHIAWIIPTCASAECLNTDHLEVHDPVRLSYPRGLCIYCGRSAGTKDHLVPRGWSGEARRKFVAVVPACGTCNSVLSDTLTWSITERRDLCHRRLKKRFRKVLATLDFTKQELAEYGVMLREYLEEETLKKAEVQRMLEWPIDPVFDLRWLQKSGIEDPYAIGLLHTKWEDEPAEAQSS